MAETTASADPASQPQTLAQLLRVSVQAWANLRKTFVLVYRADMSASNTWMVRMMLTQACKGGKLPAMDLILDSPGGSPDAAFKLANIIHEHTEAATVVVPRYAKSASTLLALSMKEIIIGEMGELGPLDTQRTVVSDGDSPRWQSSLEVVKGVREAQQSALTLWHVSANHLRQREGISVGGAYGLAAKFVGQVAGLQNSQIRFDEFGESVRQLEIGKEYAVCLLKRHRGRNAQEAIEIAEQLVEGYPSHSYVIDRDEAKQIGLPARGSETAQEAQILQQLEFALAGPGPVDYRRPVIEYLLPCDPIVEVKTPSEPPKVAPADSDARLQTNNDNGKAVSTRCEAP